MTSEDRRVYIGEIIRAVYGKEPEESRISNYEYGVIVSWLEKDIPLATILQTVEQMDKHPNVRYIRQAVEIEEERRRRAVG